MTRIAYSICADIKLNSRDSHHIMQHIVDFLSARDLCAYIQVNARTRNAHGMRDVWHAQVRARFPHKGFVDSTRYADAFESRGDARYNPREFLLNLEERARFGSRRGGLAYLHKLTEKIVETTALSIEQCARGGVKREFLIRGDLVEGSHLYMFDGLRARKVKHNYHNVLYESVKLPDFFCIPLEFDLPYIIDALPFYSELYLNFHVDTRAEFRRDESLPNEYRLDGPVIKYVISYYSARCDCDTLEEYALNGHAFGIDTFRAGHPPRIYTSSDY